MTVVDLYSIQIIRTHGFAEPPTINPDVLQRMIDETEENLTDLLPVGYRARIRRWDNPEGTDDA